MSGRWIDELRQASSSLLRTPTFLATSVGTLALAIGVAVGMFGVVNAVLLKPLPFHEPDRLVVISGTAPGSDLPERFGLGVDFYFQYGERSQLLDGLFLFGGGTSTFRTENRVERVSMGFPSHAMFTTLGVQPQLGRLPTEADGSSVIVISDRLWEEWFGRDSSIIGRSYFASDGMRQVVGVMPASFQFPNEAALLWVMQDVGIEDVQPMNLGINLVARMKPGVTHEQLAAELTQLSKALPERFGGPPAYARFIEQHRAVVESVQERFVGPTVRRSLWILLGAAAVVLLIACANVTNLFLVRVETRHRDLAVRRALGASTGALVRLQVAEGIVVALFAGVAAVVLSATTLPLFLQAAPDGIPRLSQVKLDPLTLAAAFLLVLLVALACSAVPAWRAAHPDLSRIREGGRTGTSRRHWGRDALVVAQTALALVLLIGSGLLLRSFNALRNVDPGYTTENLYTFQFAPQQEHLTDGPSWGRLHVEFMDRLRGLPGVELVGIVNNIPLDEGTGRTRYLAEGMSVEDGGLLLAQNFVAGDYFQAMGITLLRGRAFTNDEAVAPNNSVIVSRSAADQLWPNQDPVGKPLRRGGNTPRDLIVVGVVADVKQLDWRDNGDAGVYLPLTGPTADAWSLGSPAYVVKSPRAAALTREVRELVRQVAPEAPVYREFTMDFLAERAMVQLTFTMLTLGIVSALALILGAVGLYGVLAYVVAGRTKEIGVRMALGSTSDAVQKMVVLQGLRVVALGVGVGVIVAVASTRVLSTMLYGISALDPLVFVATSLTLLAVGALASYVPARRASLVDPVESLRGE